MQILEKKNWPNDKLAPPLEMVMLTKFLKMIGENFACYKNVSERFYISNDTKTPCRKSIHLWLVHKLFYNGCLWENCFEVQSEFSVQGTTNKIFLIDKKIL